MKSIWKKGTDARVILVKSNFDRKLESVIRKKTDLVGFDVSAVPHV